MLNIFYKETKEYTNKLDPVNAYIKQLTQYIKVKKNISDSEAKEKAIKILKEHFKDRTVTYFERDETGDRRVERNSLLNYINRNLKDKNIMAPTFTTYINSKKEKSILSEFIFVNVKKRAIAKKESQKAKAEGNTELAEAKNNEQNMMKIYNNSLSGAFAQEACILNNPTSHSTLTSITRTITSLSNASNEKLIAGNRYYPRPIDVLNNIVYISTYCKEDEIKNVIDKFNLYIPTVQDTVDVLKYSSNLYFKDHNYYVKHIYPYLEKLSPYQLAAICYIGDMFHLRKYNSDFIKNLLASIIKPIYKEDNSPDVIVKLREIDDSILIFAHNLFYNDIKGYGKDYEKMHKDGLASNLLYTCYHIEETLNKYKQFFNCFFMSDIITSNSFRLKHMLRRTVVLSDTDSTCFTLDDWIKWYKGDFIINAETIALAGCVSFIASQTIIHQLAILSRNMNVSDEDLHTLAMKNEFLWLVHVPAEVSKHYFAYTVIQEGNIFKKPDIEIKGVHLKNSATPSFLIDDAKKLMVEILDTVSNNKKIKITKVINRIKDIEQMIKDSVLSGESLFLKNAKIKEPEAYALSPDKSPYARHVFWKEVFEPKYGKIQDPPYDAIKIPTTITSRPKLREWFSSIKDEEFLNRLTKWVEKNKKVSLPTVFLNKVYVNSNGVPKELLDVIDIKRIILDTTIQHRTILETLGVVLYSDLLISEQFG